MSNPLPPEEGIGNYTYNLSQTLIRKGHKVTIITRGFLRTTYEQTLDGIRILRVFFLPAYPFHVALHSVFVKTLFRPISEEFDVLHMHTPLPPFIETSLPIMTTVHTPMLTDARHHEIQDFRSLTSKIMGRIVSYPLELKLLKRSDLITTVSKSVAHELLAYGIESNRVKIIGNGVDESLFTPCRHGRKEGYILFVGRLSYRKGLLDLIESAKYIIDEFADISFMIVGTGPLSSILQRRLRELNLDKKFRFLGFVDRERLVKIYQRASLFVLPSHYEGLPTVLLEAMSCGLPVVATSVSGNVDVISNGKDGILIPPKSPKRMAEAISFLLRNDNLREKLGHNAREKILKHYTWNLITDKILGHYKSIIDAKSANAQTYTSV